MKLLRIISIYPSYAAQFYAGHPGLAGQDVATQETALDLDHFGAGNSLSLAMESLGHEVMEIYPMLEPMQKAWGREQGVSVQGLGPDDLIIARARKFQPDVVSYECGSTKLLRRIRSEVGSVKLVVGWEGSAVSSGKNWRYLDLILSCAPETVEQLRSLGLQAELLGHAFNPQITNRLAPTLEPIPVSFLGGIVRRQQFHLEREKILLDLVGKIPIHIFSPNADVGWKDYLKGAAVGGAYLSMMALRALKARRHAAKGTSRIAMVERIASAPRLPVNPLLRKHLRPGVYGLKFYQVIQDSLISLNIHADSSPRYASNMRLYEATGIGSCLLTDWKPNLPTLFEPDVEVVAYRSGAEAAEKARWLLEHPSERSEIARRGQKRTLKNYTFGRQAGELDDIIGKALRGGTSLRPPVALAV